MNNNVKMSRDYVLSHIQESQSFAQHVVNVTKKYIESLNLPTEGKLFGFNFDLNEGFYTVNHSFTYDSESKVGFYRIPLSLLWEHS